MNGAWSVKQWYEYFNSDKIRFLDHTEKKFFAGEPYQAQTSFALDDALALSVGNLSSAPTIRLWVHDQTVVLGIPDTRVPHLGQALDFLLKEEQSPLVRNSGGLAVALDSGVLNMSFIMPNNNEINIHTGYDIILSFIRDLFSHHTKKIQAFEIVGSYCPGDYDLSINGIKFAGISQRRVKNGVSVQIYLDINGDSDKRALLIKEFYKRGIRNERPSYAYPVIDSRKMASLSTLLNKDLTVPLVIEDIKSLIGDHFELIQPDFTEEERNHFNKRTQQMKKRNAILSPFLPERKNS